MKKKSFWVLTAALFCIQIACNNSSNDKRDDTVVRTKADSLADEIDDGHNTGMARMASLTKAQQEVKRILDSISKLPAKARQSASPYTEKLSSLLQDLNQADSSMEKWMHEYKWNAIFNSVEEKIRYLEPEKEKVTKVKKAILNSIEKADSLLKKEF